MISQSLTDEQREVVAKIEKLLRLVGGTASEAEAASATAKAQELLAAYNLDASAVGSAEADGARTDEMLKGGFYEYERDLIAWVAELNFCLCWRQRSWVERTEADARRAKVRAYVSARRRTHRIRHEYKLVGRRVNVLATVSMVRYLLGAIERLTREFVASGTLPSGEDAVVGLGASIRGRRATSFREGCSSSIVSAIYERRQVAMRAEEEAELAARRAAEEAGTKGVSSATTLTIASLVQTERDANMDHIYGAGWSAQQRAERARRAAARAAADAATAAWALANPEEAAAQEAERRREARASERRAARRTGRTPAAGKDRDWGAFRAGADAGRTVGLDPQASGGGARAGVGYTAGQLEDAR